ncbi:tail fiber assembly protein [Aeromonas allosaccharophila]|uniref:tail fiber assembly protein n=1 Tax=Aeromonas allosaccharophila TaxID=656 RepID=UPI0034337654
MNDQRVEWGEDGLACCSGWETAHIASPLNGEYLGPCDVWVSANTGLPAGAYLDSPATCEPGHALVRSTDAWEMVSDHRGVKAYDKTTRLELVISDIGPLPSTMTLLQPTSQYDVWSDDCGWHLDEQGILSVAQSEQAMRISSANQQIAILKPAVDGGYAKPGHPQLLADWQRYRYELTAVPELAGWPESPQWPAEPEKVI